MRKGKEEKEEDEKDENNKESAGGWGKTRQRKHKIFKICFILCL